MRRSTLAMLALPLLAACVDQAPQTKDEAQLLAGQLAALQTRLVAANTTDTMRGFAVALQDRGFQIRTINLEDGLIVADRGGAAPVAMAFLRHSPRETLVRVTALARGEFGVVSPREEEFFTTHFFGPAATQLQVSITPLPGGVQPPEAPVAPMDYHLSPEPSARR